MDTTEATTEGPPSATTTLADIREAMADVGFQMDDVKPQMGDGEKPAKAAPAAKAKAEEKADGTDADAQIAALADDAAAAETTEQTEKEKEDAADLAELQGVRARARERKAKRETARTAPSPVAAAATPVAAPAAAAAAEAAKVTPANAEEAGIARHIQDVIAQIAKLTADDEAAAASTDPKNAAEAAARKDEIASLKSKADGITAALGDNKAMRDKFGAIEAKLQETIDTQKVMTHIESTIDSLTEKLPNLSTHRNAASLVYRLAENFFKKHGRAPDVAFVAEKAEAVLARRAGQGSGESPETAPAKGGETRSTTPRKTVSNRTSTPPAARKGPDTRSKEQVEADLFASLGVVSDRD
jgi:hypothetical protein